MMDVWPGCSSVPAVPLSGGQLLMAPTLAASVPMARLWRGEALLSPQ